MKKINIKLTKKQNNYTIFIGRGLIAKISELYDLSKYSKVFVVTDKVVSSLFLNKLLKGLPVNSEFIVLPKGEKEKNIDSIQKIYSAMLKADCDRKSLVINLGGGVICDMGGFAASTYMRGIDFVNIPTTLLSQVDASVGGKTGIDFANVKNLIGTFSQPKAVFIDVDVLKTLPKREFLSGFGEIIKHGLILDKNYFEKVTSKKPSEFTKQELIEIISKSCEIKKQIVEKDEDEANVRKLLNFGHTIGHAIEALSLKTNNPLLHGEAISIGMIVESRIARKIGLLSDEDVLKIEKGFKNAGLPVSISGMKTEDLKKKMKSDKKNTRGKINFTLLKKIGEAIVDKQILDEVLDEVLADAL